MISAVQSSEGPLAFVCEFQRRQDRVRRGVPRSRRGIQGRRLGRV